MTHNFYTDNFNFMFFKVETNNNDVEINLCISKGACSTVIY